MTDADAALLETARAIVAFNPRDGDFDDVWVDDAIAVAAAYVKLVEAAGPTGKQPQGDNTPPLDDGVTFKDGGGGYIR